MRMLAIMPLTATDFPEPVEPATSKWGILERSKALAVPLTAFPIKEFKKFSAFVCDCSYIVLGDTVAISWSWTPQFRLGFP